MGNYVKLKYAVQFSTIVDLDKYDCVEEDAIADILIPEDDNSHYVVGTFEVVSKQKSRSDKRR